MAQNIVVHIDGAEKNVVAEVIDKKLWFKLEGRTHSYDLLDLAEGTHRKSKTAAKSADRILAPMPGKITKVFVSEGQAVSRGDAVLVMEAMKMEYTLKADMDATIEKLMAKVGDQVVLGALLVQLKEKAQ